jgi:hypothetical protein
MKRDGLRRRGIRFHDHRGAEGKDLGHRPGHFGGVEAHGNDRVGPEAFRVRCEPFDRLVAHLFEQLSVQRDLSAGPGPEVSCDILPQSPGPNYQPKCRANDPSYVMPGNEGRRYNDHIGGRREWLRRNRGRWRRGHWLASPKGLMGLSRPVPSGGRPIIHREGYPLGPLNLKIVSIRSLSHGRTGTVDWPYQRCASLTPGM